MRWRFPDSIRGRFTLLLIAALLFCNLTAAFLLAREGTAFDAAMRVQRDMGRLVSLVDAIEESDRPTGEAILSRTMTGYTRFSIDPRPLVHADIPNLEDIHREISRALPGHKVRVIPGTPIAQSNDGSPALVIISVQLTKGERRGSWLNSLVYPLTPSSVWGQKWAFFVPLIASLVTALVVGLWILQQTTKPMKALARAALAAGSGDHTLRLDETGPREIREVASAFNTMQAQISEFEAERQQLLASVGHDLRTPLTALRLRTEVLDDDDQREPMIRLIEDMSVMISDILTCTRDEAPSEPTIRADLDQLIAEICAIHGIPYAAKGPQWAQVQPVAMRRAIGNLVTNALRYAGHAEVELHSTPDCYEIRVEDTGPGIPEARLKSVLAPFVRGEESRSRDTGGYGLGLTIANRIITGHGGRLVLTNKPTTGLRASLYLPHRSAPDVLA